MQPVPLMENLYLRTTNFFTDTILFKAAESDPPSSFFSFAPLLLQELKSTQHIAAQSQRFGTLFVSNGVVCIDTARPAIYAAIDTIESAPGTSNPRFTYIWCYPGTGRASPCLQGVRVVLESQGRPAIWQIMADTSGAQSYFVSESLEAAAAARYGKVLPGRRYAVERSRADMPQLVVARVLDESPVPMGPIVYVLADRHDVSTVICRCMSAQAKRVAEACTYELLPFAAHESLLLRVRDQAKLKPTFWPGASDPSSNLRDLLRLP